MLKLTIQTDNAAFDDEGLRLECARILRQCAADIFNGADLYILRDLNGNAVGKMEVRTSGGAPKGGRS